ncbi:hypothetical protein BDF21DRAFT_491618 [Thamnidium elegans]|nr:hypothetical protein BDF21DRAFT_491618 [Thamnidium elegans]
MDELYNFHQHDYFSIISLGESKIYVTALLNTGKVLPAEDFSCSEEACIVYDKQKTEVLSWGDPYFEQDNEEHSLIQRCDAHNQSDDCAILDLFSLKAEKEFKKNLGRYISNDVLVEGSNIRGADIKTIQLSESCSCKVCFTVDDIINISFRPIIKDIASTVSVSFLNSEFFNNYEYLFNVICFNDNQYLHNILAKILEEETNDFNEEQSIDTLCFVIPESPYKLLRPTLTQRPTSYTGFLIGTLHQVYREDCAFYLSLEGNDCFKYNTKIPEIGLIGVTAKTGFLLFRKGDKIPAAPLNQQFYFNVSKCLPWIFLIRPKTIENVLDGGMIHLENRVNYFASSSFYPTLNDLSISISVISSAYSASLGFMVKLVGGESHQSYIIAAEPMTLSRF